MVQDPQQHFLELLQQFKYGMLTTHARDGQLHTRPMVIAKIDASGELWLISDIHSEKVEELTEDPRASLSMQDGQRFVALHGKGQVVRDPQKVRALWNEAYRVWFPNGVDDPSLILLRIDGIRGEFWDNGGLNKAKYIYQAAKAYVTGTTPPSDRDLQAKVDLS